VIPFDKYREHFQGSALGTFVGDALGREIEGWPREAVEARYGLFERMGRGLYTDDTEMMIGIMESLIESPRFDPALTAQKFLENFHPERGYGARIYGVMERIREGVRWDRVGTDSWGNGAAMRIAPIGFFFHDDREALREVALRSAWITHQHPDGMAGALSQALAVAMATEAGIKGEGIEFDGFLDELIEASGEVSPPFAKVLERVRSLKGTEGLGEKIRAVASTFPCDVSAPGAVPAAIAAFLLGEGFRECVLVAVNSGGDTDTIGAMAGAIAGAYYGLSAIPEEWIAPLENGPKGRDYVLGLARRLAELKAGR